MVLFVPTFFVSYVSLKPFVSVYARDPTVTVGVAAALVVASYVFEFAAAVTVMAREVTVSEFVALLDENDASPANEALTPLASVPTFVFGSVALASVATPLALVVALPTLDPLSVKLIDLPFTPAPPLVCVSVAVSEPVPP
jgi:hypothetical protein